MSTFLDLTGHTYGRWTVLSRAKSKPARVRWNCRCACGTLGVVSSNKLRSRPNPSCGCYLRDFNVARNTTHGLSGKPEYGVWCKLKDRCFNPAVRNFRDYGGRGITVCDRWRDDFAAFYADMGPRPSARHQIERLDNNGPYSPDNCAWATPIEQANNKRNNTVLTLGDESHTLAEWSRKTGLSATAICLRLYRRKWSIEKSLTTPLNASRHAYLTLDGATRSIKEWSALTGIGKTTIHQRLKMGWSVERALTTPVR